MSPIAYQSFFEQIPDGFRIDREHSAPWELLLQREEVLLSLHDCAQPLTYVHVYGEGPLEVAADARIFPGATLERPVRIGAGSTVMPGALVRRSWVGANCIIGHCVEVARSVLLDRTAVPHQSVILDSIIGSGANISGGARTANVTLIALRDRCEQEVLLKFRSAKVPTGLMKLGLVAGDGVITPAGLNTHPGTLVGKQIVIYPRDGQALRGVWLSCREIARGAQPD